MTAEEVAIRRWVVIAQCAAMLLCAAVLSVVRLYAHAMLQGNGKYLSIWAVGPFLHRSWVAAVVITLLMAYPVFGRKLLVAVLLAAALYVYQVVGLFRGAAALAQVGLTPWSAFSMVWPEFFIYPAIVALSYALVNGVKWQSNSSASSRGRHGWSGFTLVEILVVVAIIAIVAGIVIPIFARVQHRAHDATDISNLRQIYMAIAMYEESNEASPPSLMELKPYIQTVELYKSPSDLVTSPDPKTGDYKAKPFSPDREIRSPFRISYAYHKTYPPNDRDDLRWRDLRARSEVGILASPWSGDRDPEDPTRPGTYLADGPCMVGPILRINMDGSLFKLPKNRMKLAVGSVQDFFFFR